MLPSFEIPHPTVVINYRWPGFAYHDLAKPSEASGSDPQLGWPTPLHDVLFGYQWIVQNLFAPGSARRDIYLYGSYLGATLAASLALTECYPHQQMAVRGLAAVNGIYNWTTFLPDHPIHKSRSTQSPLGEADDERRSTLHSFKQKMTSLFRRPGDLFDPFASPSLFFHSPGLFVPEDFHTSTLSSPFRSAVDELSNHAVDGSTVDSTIPVEQPKPPRKGYLVFPPRKSPLKIPETLLVHESAPRLRGPTATRRGRRPGAGRRRALDQSSFEAQAVELGGLMRRSIERIELAERRKWDEEYEDWNGEAERRVQVIDAGKPDEVGQGQLSFPGADPVAKWLGEKLKGDGGRRDL